MTEDLPSHFEIIELRSNINGYAPSDMPYYYIDKNMNLYEKRKISVTGSIFEEWQFIDALEKAESSKDDIVVWKTSSTDFRGYQTHQVFYFHENGKMEFGYGYSESSLNLYRMKAVENMTGQLNVISIESLREDIGGSYHGTNILLNTWKRMSPAEKSFLRS